MVRFYKHLFLTSTLLMLLALCSCGPFGVIPLIGAAAGGGGGGGGGDNPPALPGKVTNPNPFDGATNVPITTSIAWLPDAGAGSYDVYFGTNQTAVENANTFSSEFIGNTAGTSYDPSPVGNLNNNTTYYWRIDSGNAAGWTKGDVWKFTTEDVPITAPDVVANPQPTNGQSNLSVNVTLQWDAAARADSYDVYFGTNSTDVSTATTADPEFKGNQTGLVYDPPGSLANDTTYYWRIDSKNAVGTTTGGVWSFTTIPAPPVADFTVNPLAGTTSTTFTFTDASSGSITSWSWNFGAGASPATAGTQGPHFVTYSTTGDKTITLNVTGPGGSDGETKPDHITVSAIPVITVYVDDTSGDDFNDGLTWLTAFKTIQKGLDSVGSGSTVLVADGTYTGTSNRELDFNGKDLLLQSDTGAASCIIDCLDLGRGLHFHSGETAGAVVDGFTIYNGKIINGNGAGILCEASSSPTIRNCVIKECIAVYISAGGEGGGIHIDGCDPVITDTKVTACTAESFGGGIYAVNSSVTIATCVVEHNDATTGDNGPNCGGGIQCWNSDPTIIGCTVTDNFGFDYGGGITLDNCTGLVQGCTIDNNDSTFGGGIQISNLSTATVTGCDLNGNTSRGIYVDGNSDPTITDCTIKTSNWAGIDCNGAAATIESVTMDNNSGVGLATAGASVYVTDCYITNNNSSGAFCQNSTGSQITNCVIANNKYSGIEIYNESITFTNCTIVNNDAFDNGGGLYCDSSFPIFNNCIIWGNTAPTSGLQIHNNDAGSTVTLKYCDFPDNGMDPNNITGPGTVSWTGDSFHLDPEFEDPGSPGVGNMGDYRLKSTSSCINAGDDSLVPGGITHDIEGNLRIIAGAVDMGAYEFPGLRVPVDYGTIQAAIDAAAAGSTVLVADGTYTGAGNKNLDPGGKDITVISENGPTGCTIDCQDSGRGFYFHSGETSETLVSGFTITSGNVVGNGGGILCENNSNPKIVNCIITGNTESSPSGDVGGAGICCINSSPIISYCTISNNVCTGSTHGGGIRCYNSAHPTVMFCVITNNTAGLGGGIMCHINCDPTFVNCLVFGNTATPAHGGGIALEINCNPDILWSWIINNWAQGTGGGIYSHESSATIHNTTIAGNTASTGGGGGIAWNEGSGADIINCVIRNNYAGGNGGGVAFFTNTGTTATNCTIAGNYASGDGGGAHFDSGSSITVNNCILWSNGAGFGGHSGWINDAGSTVTMNYCCFPNGPDEGGGDHGPVENNCFYANPRFVAPIAGNFRLRYNSPCVDAGDDIYVSTSNDLDGKTRIIDGDWDTTLTVDIGAYEFRGLRVPLIYGTIQAGIDAAEDGDTVLIADGTYTGAGNKDLDFSGKSVIVSSRNGPANCIIDCQSSGRGFHFHTQESLDATVDGLTIDNGWLDPGDGAGIMIENDSSPTLNNLIITNCTANGPSSGTYGQGGAIYINSSDPIISNCIMMFNAANTSDLGGAGGGIYSIGFSSPYIINCLVANNSSNYIGGGICPMDSDAEIISCTVVYNDSRWGGGLCSGSNITYVDNSIVWGNTASAAANQIYSHNNAGVFIMTNCDYGNALGDLDAAGPVSPAACINVDPLFVAPGSQDYHLQNTSPCIDMGDNLYVNAQQLTDVEGNPRIVDGNDPVDGTATVDIGVYELRNWADRAPGFAPAPRNCENNMAFDSHRSEVVLFGGNDAGYYDETWVWNGGDWQSKSPGTKPDPRSYHAMTYDSTRREVVLFGGTDGTRFGDTWVWNGSNWDEKFPGTTPGVRHNHGMVYDSARKVVVMFGGDASGAWNSQTWEWNGSNWSNASPGGTEGIHYPNARGYHAMAYDSRRGVVVLHGGWNGGNFNDTWEWNGTTWTKKTPGTIPSGRHAHMMAYDSNRGVMMMWGGNLGASFDDETWEWDGTNWVQRFPTNKPSARAYYGMVYDSTRGVFVLFGGHDTLYSDDTWEY